MANNSTPQRLWLVKRKLHWVRTSTDWPFSSISAHFFHSTPKWTIRHRHPRPMDLSNQAPWIFPLKASMLAQPHLIRRLERTVPVEVLGHIWVRCNAFFCPPSHFACDSDLLPNSVSSFPTRCLTVTVRCLGSYVVGLKMCHGVCWSDWT